MSLQLDPEDSETTALLDFADFTNKRVLEIGCGDGRLTWRYADRAARVIAIDPEADRIEAAIKDTPAHLKDRVEFQVSSLEEFNLAKGLGTNDNSQLKPSQDSMSTTPVGEDADRPRPGRRGERTQIQASQGLFDIVFTSWSLC